MRLWPLAVPLLALAIAPAAHAGDGTFRALDPTLVGSAPYGVTLGDLNNDGKLDVGTINRFDQTFTALAGNGAGGLSITASPGAGGNPLDGAILDANNDGNLDLLASNRGSGPNGITLALGNGAGGFGTPTGFATNASGDGYELALGDLNGDGNQDAVIAQINKDSLGVYLSNGSGGFGAINSYGTGDPGTVFPEAVATGDFNADGAEDAMSANGSANILTFMPGNGAGVLGGSGQPPTGPVNTGVIAGDFNGDMKLDVAAANNDDGTVSVLLGNGAGSFATASTPSVGESPESIAAGDFNSDGREDLATANGGTDDVSVLLGNGDGTFAVNPTVTVGNAPRDLAVGDLDGDGNQDLAVVNQGGSTVRVLLGNGPSPRSGNLLAGGAAEGAGAARTAGAVPEIPGFARTSGAMTFVRYGTGGFPSLFDTARWGGGSAFFAGGPAAADSSAQQAVSLAGREASIDAGLATASLSGLLGGYRAQEDAASVSAAFLDAAGNTLGTALQIGPVTPAERGNLTRLVSRTAAGAIPAGARSILVAMRAHRVSGSYNDAYLDELKLTVNSPGAAGGSPLIDATAAVMSRFRFSPRSFAALPRGGSIISGAKKKRKARQGARVSYGLSENATVTFTISRQLKGRRKGRRCVTRRGTGRRCTLLRRVRGSFMHSGKAGTNNFKFSGRLRRRKLLPGRYRMTGVPVDAAGNKGKPVLASFTIVR